jgi:hypothetical protein
MAMVVNVTEKARSIGSLVGTETTASKLRMRHRNRDAESTDKRSNACSCNGTSREAGGLSPHGSVSGSAGVGKAFDGRRRSLQTAVKCWCSMAIAVKVTEKA